MRPGLRGPEDRQRTVAEVFAVERAHLAFIGTKCGCAATSLHPGDVGFAGKTNPATQAFQGNPVATRNHRQADTRLMARRDKPGPFAFDTRRRRPVSRCNSAIGTLFPINSALLISRSPQSATASVFHVW